MSFFLFIIKPLKRVSSYPACQTIEENDGSAKPRRHEQTQSQHESEDVSTDFTTFSDETPQIMLENSNTSGNSREPLLAITVNSNNLTN